MAKTLDKELIKSFSSLNNEEKLELLSSLINSMKPGSKDSIPISIFNNEKLSIFEALVKYMRENLKMRFVKIASLIGRSDKTIWITYRKSKEKMPYFFSNLSSELNVPIESFSNSNLTIFESLVLFLKEKDLTNHEVAVMLHRDDRTIWSIYDRAKKKTGKIKDSR